MWRWASSRDHRRSLDPVKAPQLVNPLLLDLHWFPCVAVGAQVARMKFDLSGPATSHEEGCGPLRLWPGGLHMSRAMGDFDCGQPVIPHPHIQQVRDESS